MHVSKITERALRSLSLSLVCGLLISGLALGQCPNELIVDGPLTLGDVGSCTPTAGMIHWDGNALKVHDGTDWISVMDGDGSGQWSVNPNGIHYDTDNVGIGTMNPLSKLSIGGDGNAKHALDIFVPKATIRNERGIYSYVDGATGSADHVTAITGNILSGNHFSKLYGVLGVAGNPTPSSSGRGFGVFGHAYNADVNIGVFGRLSGSNGGTAVLGYDVISHGGWSEVVRGNWAGYFHGNSYVSDKLTIGGQDFPSLAGDIDVSAFKLFVRGGILTEEVVVDNNANWADYVFLEDYSLLELNEVENFIKENGHLHNMPSASDIEESGIALGNISILQQEKIEELFLHAIKLEKENRELKSKLDDIERRLSQLEK